MSESNYKSFAYRLLEEVPGLRRAMAQSPRFAELKERYALDEVGGEQVYLVNDTQGGEDELYVDALAKGAKASRRRATDESGGDIYQELFMELDDDLRALAGSILGREKT